MAELQARKKNKAKAMELLDELAAKREALPPRDRQRLDAVRRDVERMP
jgi:hypothetical protein